MRAYDLAEIKVRGGNRHVFCWEIRSEHIKRCLLAKVQRRVREVATFAANLSPNDEITAEQIRN